MAKKQELRAIISADDRQFMRAMGRVKHAAVNMAKAVGVAGIAGAAFSIREVMRFEQGMAEVNTLARMSGAAFAQLQSQIRDLAKDFGLDLPDAIKAAYDAISAGIKTEDLNAFLRVAAKSSIAGVTDLTTAVDGLTTVINAYGLTAADAARVSDMLFSVVEQGKVTYGELSQNIGTLAPTAKAAGVSLEQLGALMSTLLRVEKPERAMTSLRAVLMKAAEGGETIFEVLERLRGKDLEGIMKAGFSRQAGTGIALLLNNYEELTRQLQIAENASGKTDRAFEMMAKTAHFEFKQLQAELKDIAVTVGFALLPAVRTLMGELRKLTGDKAAMRDFANALQSWAQILITIAKIIHAIQQGMEFVLWKMTGFEWLMNVGWRADDVAKMAKPISAGDVATARLERFNRRRNVDLANAAAPKAQAERLNELVVVSRQLLDVSVQRLPIPGQ